MTEQHHIDIPPQSASNGDTPTTPQPGDSQIPRRASQKSTGGSFRNADRLTPQSPIEELAEYVVKRYLPAYKHSVQVNYKNVLTYYILPDLGPEAIEELDNVEVLEDLLLQWKDTGVKRSTINARLSVLTLLIEAAHSRDLIKKNRLKMAKKVLAKGNKSQATPFTPEEETTLVSAFQQMTLMYACLFLLLLRTGMRIGEALGLKIEDINLTKRLITIRRTWTCGAEDTPKYNSARTIAIPPDLFLVLARYMQFIRQEEAVRWLLATEWLFPGVSRLRPITLGWLRTHIWAPMLAEHGIPYRRIHDLRHTFATAILEKGRSIRTLQKLSAWLGHSGPHVTLGIYAHLFDGDHLDLVNDIGTRRNSDELRHCPTCQHPLPSSTPQS